jgi:integrase
MGVTLRKRGDKWHVVVHFRSQRKAKCVGTSRTVAEKVRRAIEERLALGDLGFFDAGETQEPSAPTLATFGDYAEKWLKHYAAVHCKPSTVHGYEQTLRLHVVPQFGSMRLGEITREDVKDFLVEKALSGKFSRNTVRIILCTVRVILNSAIDDELLEKNPAARLGKFTKVEKAPRKATALTRDEVDRLLSAAQEVCPDYYPLFLTAVRTGLRRGELVALRFGDLYFGVDENDSNRYLLIRNNYVLRQFTSTKSKKERRVDMSRQLRQVLLELREQRERSKHSERSASVMIQILTPLLKR